MSSLYGQFTLCSLNHNATLDAVSIEKKTMLNKRFVNYVAGDRRKIAEFCNNGNWETKMTKRSKNFVIRSIIKFQRHLKSQRGCAYRWRWITMRKRLPVRLAITLWLTARDMWNESIKCLVRKPNNCSRELQINWCRRFIKTASLCRRVRMRFCIGWHLDWLLWMWLI